MISNITKFEEDIFLTVKIPPSFDLNRTTRTVERTTEANGQAAEIQKSFGFLMLCIQENEQIT